MDNSVVTAAGRGSQGEEMGINKKEDSEKKREITQLGCFVEMKYHLVAWNPPHEFKRLVISRKGPQMQEIETYYWLSSSQKAGI